MLRKVFVAVCALALLAAAVKDNDDDMVDNYDTIKQKIAAFKKAVDDKNVLAPTEMQATVSIKKDPKCKDRVLPKKTCPKISRTIKFKLFAPKAGAIQDEILPWKASSALKIKETKRALETALRLTGDSFPQDITVYIYEYTTLPFPVAYVYKESKDDSEKIFMLFGAAIAKYQAPNEGFENKIPDGAPCRGGFKQGATLTVGNLVYKYWADKKKRSQAASEMYFTNIVHEFCHIMHQFSNPDSYWPTSRAPVSKEDQALALRGVSYYAGSPSKVLKGGMNEFVAEVCAGTLSGVEFTKEVKDRYAALGGPTVTGPTPFIPAPKDDSAKSDETSTDEDDGEKSSKDSFKAVRQRLAHIIHEAAELEELVE